MAASENSDKSRNERRRGGNRGQRGRGEGPVAALDLGTNNCRLLVARPQGKAFEVVDAFSRAVRLGEGVEQSNVLSAEAQDRALKALRICAGKIRHHRVRDHRIVATEACRRAENGPEFVRRVNRETGLTLDIISPEEEARLAVAGCAPLIDPEAEQLLVFDIGGGSTELIWINMSGTPSARRENLVRALAPLGRGRYETATARAAAAHIEDWISVPMGVSTLHDRFASIESDAQRFKEMSGHFEERLASFGPCVKAKPGHLQIIGVSGTATTFGALHLGLQAYDRSRVDGLWLPADAAADVAGGLLEMNHDTRARHPGIGRGRSEFVVSGSAILMTILRLWPVERMRIADRGLREGILYGLIQARKDRQI